MCGDKHLGGNKAAVLCGRKRTGRNRTVHYKDVSPGKGPQGFYTGTDKSGVAAWCRRRHTSENRRAVLSSDRVWFTGEKRLWAGYRDIFLVFVNDVYIIGKTALLLLTRGFKWVIIVMFGAAAAAPILLKGIIRNGYG